MDIEKDRFYQEFKSSDYIDLSEERSAKFHKIENICINILSWKKPSKENANS